MTAGSSVPEAARAAAKVTDEVVEAAIHAVWDAEPPAWTRAAVRAGLEAAAPFVVAAAVAEERATTGRRIEALEASIAKELERTGFFGWLLSSGHFDLWTERTPEQEMARVVTPIVRAALASPGEET